MTYTAYLQKSKNPKKKYTVVIFKNDNKVKTVHFGASGYLDYTKHHDKDRMKLYDSRHKSRENWTKSGITTAGFWSKWILWSKPNLTEAIKYTSKKFNIKIIRGAPPKSKSPKRKSKSRRRKSPKRKSKSPKRKSKSRRRKSPKRKSKSPKRKSKSPKRKSKSRRCKSSKNKF